MAGLHAPVVYGGVERKEYILEANGCGCAFLDFDDDGWLDIFGLSGTRLEGPPVGATNRQYRNNRDGTLTDVTTAARLEAVGWANNVCVGDSTTTALMTSSAPTTGRTGCIKAKTARLLAGGKP